MPLLHTDIINRTSSSVFNSIPPAGGDCSDLGNYVPRSSCSGFAYWTPAGNCPVAFSSYGPNALKGDQ
ncbi:hypothetical protein BDM02DRAFT_3124889 [Thelephora ganbajun]|uniref:Uncharacterized protein n=1 Tax=Thelephora ganbajun TaxID=370292 RepID=A0ACB6YXR6_THEGA|nr:hypothetical protein BDM02DRAFT_3124889 [Thelephora ganbajun]